MYFTGTGLDNHGALPPEVTGPKKNRLPGLRGIVCAILAVLY